MNWRVLVTARAFWVSGAEAQQLLESAGCEVVHAPRCGPLTEEEILPWLSGFDAVIASSDAYNERVFAASPALKIVSRCGVGYDSVDLEAAARAGVVVTITPGAMTDAVADYTFALLLAIARQVPAGDALMRTGGWTEIPGVLVWGKTLGLVGFGRIGQAVAQRAAGFRMRVLAYDPLLQEAAAAGRAPGLPPAEFVSLDQLLEESDFVSLHAPSGPETRGLMNARRLSQMKPTAYLVNTARGALVDEPALLEALESGQIAGAAIDVYTKEPFPEDHPLRKAPRCVLTPHNAFNALESVRLMCQASAENVITLMRGAKPEFTINPDVWHSDHLRVPRA